MFNKTNIELRRSLIAAAKAVMVHHTDDELLLSVPLEDGRQITIEVRVENRRHPGSTGLLPDGAPA